jgi:hypothetical protein
VACICGPETRQAATASRSVREHSILARLQLLAYDFHRGPKHEASGRGDSQSRHRLILDRVDGSLHIAGDLLDSFPYLATLLGSVVGELFDVLGDVSRLIGRLVSQPAELVGILVEVPGAPTAT